MKKKVISIILAAFTAASLAAGCGNITSSTSSETNSATDSAKAEDSSDVSSQMGGTEQSVGEQEDSDENAQTITMMCWYQEDVMDEVIDAINTKLDGKYKVEYTYITNSDYNNVLSTQLAAGEGPDVIADGANFPARIKAGNLVDLTDTGLADGFSEEGLSLCSQDGKIYGVPCYGWFAGVFYNKDLFEKAGITELPMTFDDFLNVCRKLQDAGIQPLSMGLADSDNALHSICGFMESNYYAENGREVDTEFAYGEKKLADMWKDPMAKWYRLVDEGYITPDMVGISGENALDVFENGKAAMFYTGPWYYNEFTDAGLRFGVLPFTGDTEDETYLVGGPAASWGINANSDHQDGAMAVMKALASVEVQQAFINENAGSSTYREGVETGLPSEYDAVSDTLSHGRIACCWDRWSVNMPSQSMVDEINSTAQGLVSGDTDVDGFLQALDDKADSIRYE